MDTEFLVQMRQSNKCGSVRKDEIFNLHLGSSVSPWVSIQSNDIMVAMILSKCAICGSKKWRFIKNQEAKGLLSNLDLKIPVSKKPVSGDILFWMHFHWSATSLGCIKKWMK